MGDQSVPKRTSICRRLYSRIKRYKLKALSQVPWTRSMPARIDPEPKEQNPLPESAFMKLPVELRLLIYSHLVPNSETVSGILKGTWVPPQYDGESCSLALLQTNRQIYYEMIESWYRLATYSMWITRDNNLRFLNRDFKSIASLPFGFQFLTSLSLAITPILWRSGGVMKEAGKDDNNYEKKDLQHLDLVKGVADFFSPSGPGNLQNLDLIIDFTPHFFISILWPSTPARYPPPNWREIVQKCLEVNFDCLKGIRVSRSISVVYYKEKRGMMALDHEIRQGTTEIRTEYFNSLKKEISRI